MNIEDYELKHIIEPLLDWFFQHARILPWRADPSPYRVWVSEIMLQQTRVEAVKPYFERFVQALPGVKELAECEEEKLLKLWEGLGYYNRVRNMQLAARQIMDQYNGTLPREYEQLISLKGIGSYTAGAIASIAYGKAVPAVDGNVLRVISRVSMDDRDILSAAVKKNMEQQLLEIMPPEASGFNQALMELGAMICIPNGAPKCEQCPLHTLCLTKENQAFSRIPVKSKSGKRRVEEHTILLIRDGDRILLNKRPTKGLLAGLYEFVNLNGFRSEEEVLQMIGEMELRPLQIQQTADAKHIFSHVEWQMKGYLIRVEALSEEEEKKYILAEISDFKDHYPIPSAFSAYAELLQIRHGMDAARIDGQRGSR
ncbi:MAG: A/G-specific adenine glycosylase [Lachnospiraceae bacterium]